VQRKTVTVLFCDVTGSTALGESVDPEALRALLARYFERMKTIVERHGGTVEKFIGDAVMAVFGVPMAHEDDALRAVRAAAEMREALPELGVRARIGVNTGEVVTGTEERLATGDAVNVAARLEQAAAPDQVLLGAQTLALVREAVEVVAVEPLELKGKAEPVTAYRLLRVHETPERRHESRFVGRTRELALLREASQRAQAEQRCELVTIVGDAGVGKSRLVAELLAALDTRVVRGRCLPYGEGITYWPVVEVLKQLDAEPTDAAAAAALRALLGEGGGASSAEEIAWAFRKLLEEQAPLALVFDDIQWGEETFLDLVEHVALLSSGASILLVCLARPELAERRPAWPVTLRLGALAEDEVEELLPNVLASDLRARIARAAGGNPLFLTEMLAMTEEANGDVIVPPTLQALLAARLDQLDPAERRVLERGAVEGEVFHRGAVQALAPDEQQVTPRLAALVRRELIRPHRAQLPGDDGFRFRHLLIRDAAYDALPKAERAELHERFAHWLEERGAELVELDEILGYHLEQALHYKRELGLPDDPELRATARKRLGAAGERAFVRADYGAAVRLLERAADLVSATELDLTLDFYLVDALFWGGMGRAALDRARSIAERAAAAGDRVGELCGKIEQAVLRTYLEPEGATDQAAALVEEALPVFEASGDDFALYVAYRALGQVQSMRAQMDALAYAYDRAAEHAARAGLATRLVGWRELGRFHGSTPVSEHLAWSDEQEDLGPWSMGRRAWALAMLGRFEDARALLVELRGGLAERGGKLALGITSYEGGLNAALLAGDAAAALDVGEEGCRLLEELGQWGTLSTAAGWLGQAYHAAARFDEAESWAVRAAELGASDDAITQMLWRQVRGKVLARRGAHDEAERLAREAVAIGDETQMLNAQADAYADLAEVLGLAGRREEAAATLEEARARYERKGNLVMSERTRARLDELRSSA
jgi:class 3 adenylate cyclase/tetratricopeptide (TPR) repeat protein